jgi:acyl-CoA synthetase (AMP-forming)/AMP-acid ligase II
VVALKDGEQTDREDLFKYCKDRLPDYRVPKSILIRDMIPRDPAGKLLRRVLRQDAREA